MKNTVLAFLCLLSVTMSYAQFTKGRFLLGGDASLGTLATKIENGGSLNTVSNSSYLQLGPKAGYFVADNIVVGAGLGLDFFSTKSKGVSPQTKSNSTGIYFEPFARYYLPQKIFFQAEVGFGSTKGKTVVGPTESKSTVNSTMWSVGAGYAYFLNDQVALEPFLGYYRRSNGGSPVQSNFGLSLGLQVYLSRK